MNLKKIIPCLLALCMILSACQNVAPVDPTEGNIDLSIENMTQQYDQPFTMTTSEGGKGVLLNRSQVPVIMTSALLRTDLLVNADFLEPSEMEDYFAIAKETNLNTLELTVMWSQIEPEKDKYDFSALDTYLNYAKKYGLKLNIVWYGSMVDGETHTANVPDYISEDTETYSCLMDLFDYANFGRCRIMDWSDPDLLERESRAVWQMMNHVYEWNQSNDKYDPVIMVQIGQGADRFQRWRVAAYDVVDAKSEPMTQEQAWSMVHTYLNTVAKAVKYSAYKALTRAEFCEQTAVVNYVRDVQELEFVDIVSPTYLHEISSTKNGIKSFTDEYSDMFIMNAENWASDANHRQILATFGMGAGGYVSYQLSSPNYYPESPNGALYSRYNPKGATLAEKFQEKGQRATQTAAVNSALLRAFVAVANAPRSLFATFGLNNLLNSKTGDERIQKIYLSNGILLSYSNPEDTLGFAAYDGNYVYVWSGKDATLSVTNCTLTVCQKGAFDENGEWVGQGNVTLEGNTTLQCQAGEVYRIRVGNISQLPAASTLKAEGFLSPLDSIRG